MKRAKTSALVVSLLVAPFALGVLSACSTDAGAIEPSLFTADETWANLAAADVELYQSEMIDCLAAHGVRGRRTWGGNVKTSISLPPGINVPDPVAVEQLRTAWEECGREVGIPNHWRAQPDEIAYSRMLQTRDCLAGLGVPVPAPPGFEEWVAQDPVAPDPVTDPERFNPWRFLRNEYRSILWSDHELAEFARMCPQSMGTDIFSIERFDSDLQG